MNVVESIANDPAVVRLRSVLSTSTGTVHVTGAWGSSAPMVAAMLVAELGRPCLYLTAHSEAADDIRDDIELFLAQPCELFPAWETIPGEGVGAGEIDAERTRLCASLNRTQRNASSGAITGAIVAPIQAIMQPVPMPEAIARNTLVVSVGDSTSPETLLEWCIDRGYERLELVESPRDVAHRGDLVDLFPPGEHHPVRIEFLDDTVESIRRFDIGTQRSIESLTTFSVTAMGDHRWVKTDAKAMFADYLPPNCLVILDEPSEIQTMGETLRKRLGTAAEMFEIVDVLARVAEFPQLQVTAFGAAATSDEETIPLDVKSLSRFEVEAADAVAQLSGIALDHNVHVYCDTEGERHRLAEMIGESTPDAARRKRSIELHLGVLHRGFEWASTKTIIVPHHEIFHRHRRRRRIRKVEAGRPLDTWLDLLPGEYVVHVVHGIAIYRGLAQMRKGDTNDKEEYLTLEFAGESMVHVPCSQIDLVQKYIGAGGRKPELSKIGGRRWARTKQQVADAISDMAESLLRVQAVRDSAVGITYPPDTEWQREFEAAFPYDETEDQLVVAEEIRGDLMRARPMDRLVCGDVGYGKTELAMRAAFKVVEYGRQVAVLVPTTVLAEQHYRSFRERMAEYPFTIECLSRFRSGSEQKKIIERLAKGQVDIIIGTHRLVSDDVRFANLGLVVVDEEQRFGVAHKEKLKRVRETVDLLTLTATPIPRTLHMALMGIRDISSLQTPPVDRRSIATLVRPFSAELIRSAIYREMERDGQVFFVHNFVNSIATIADELRAIVPDARIIFGHGQMKTGELEDVMNRFVRREADVLVATTIIESGLDMPSVNTIFINRGDRLGLADLHQLRGRVGRSHHRAYCYVLLPRDRPPTPKAAKRLKTIEEFSELGAGFRIAMRDLEIRGAGSLLGSEQSGHIAAVGYEMYCRLLTQTVRKLRDEPDPTPPPVQLDLDVAGHIPRHYIKAERARLEMYRRIVACTMEPDLVQLKRDLSDAFGPAPRQVEELLDLAEVRVHARRFGILSISRKPPDVVLTVKDFRSVEPLFVDANGSVRTPDAKTVYFRPPTNYLEPLTLVRVLRAMFKRAIDRVGATV